MPLSRSIDRFYSEFALRPVTAAEIEFYLSSTVSTAECLERVRAACAASGIALQKVEAERGPLQYEIALAVAGPQKTVDDLYAVKRVIAEAARASGGEADFSAKPFDDQPGSGLHVHVHLADESGRNVFYKDDARMSDALRFSIGGLLASLPRTMLAFAPTAASYRRFAPGGSAPTTVSWGANNRTVAVRLPDKPHHDKHIEHRVAGADADPEAAMAAILEGMAEGLRQRIDPGPQIHGDASLPMYGLPLLPRKLEEATRLSELLPPASARTPMPL